MVICFSSNSIGIVARKVHYGKFEWLERTIIKRQMKILDEEKFITKQTNHTPAEGHHFQKKTVLKP